LSYLLRKAGNRQKAEGLYSHDRKCREGDLGKEYSAPAVRDTSSAQNSRFRMSLVSKEGITPTLSDPAILEREAGRGWGNGSRRINRDLKRSGEVLSSVWGGAGTNRLETIALQFS